MKFSADAVENVSRMSLEQCQAAYAKLAKRYKKLLESVYCPMCDQHKSKEEFYTDLDSPNGVSKVCRKCAQKVGTGYDEITGKANCTKETIIEACKLLDRPFKQKAYNSAVAEQDNFTAATRQGSIFSSYIRSIQSLPQYKGLHFADSDGLTPPPVEDEDSAEKFRVTKAAKERFGDGYEDWEYVFLEKEYKDWTSRNDCPTKSHELIFKRICITQLDIHKKTLNNQDTTKLDENLMKLLEKANLTPKQMNLDGYAEDKTFGQLIAAWEEYAPIPEPSPEFADVDNIGKYIDVFYRGHMCKMLNIKNSLSQLYDDYMSQYTVEKPEYEEDTEALFEAIFGENSQYLEQKNKKEDFEAEPIESEDTPSEDNGGGESA